VGVLAPIDLNKLNEAIDLKAMRNSIMPYTAMNSTRGEALCSLFQTGSQQLSARDIRWLEGIANRDPEVEGRYLALTLGAILTRKAHSKTVGAVLQAIDGRLKNAMEQHPPNLNRSRRMLANYLMTARIFGAKEQTIHVNQAIDRLFPQKVLAIPMKLHSHVLEEMVIAHLLGWKVSATKLKEMIERSRINPKDPQSQIGFSDCDGITCQYKAYQTAMSIDQLVGIWTPKERQDHLDLLLKGLGDNAEFGHVRTYGLKPSDLWKGSRCDYFCSVKHWTVLATLNHLLNANRP